MKFHLYLDRKGDYRWSLHSDNGKKIADSAEGYKRRSSAKKGILLVQSYATQAAPVIEVKRK